MINVLNTSLALKMKILLDLYVLFYLSGYIAYFDNDGKNMSFKIEDNRVLLKYNDIWIKIKKTLDIKFYSKDVYHEKHIKTKVKTFNGVVTRFFQTIKFLKNVFMTFV